MHDGSLTFRAFERVFIFHRFALDVSWRKLSSDIKKKKKKIEYFIIVQTLNLESLFRKLCEEL